MNYIAILEYVGVLAFAISGANVAIEEEFDLFGIYILATVTAMGGGVIRDIVTDVSIPVFFQDYNIYFCRSHNCNNFKRKHKI